MIRCGVVANPNEPNCRKVRDMFKQYPNCCEQIVCDNAYQMQGRRLWNHCLETQNWSNHFVDNNFCVNGFFVTQ